MKYMLKTKHKPGFGNKKSHSDNKTKRKFGINYKQLKLWSFILNGFVYIKSSMRLIKSIRHYGGIDFYIINNNDVHEQVKLLRDYMVKNCFNEHQQYNSNYVGLL